MPLMLRAYGFRRDGPRSLPLIRVLPSTRAQREKAARRDPTRVECASELHKARFSLEGMR